jgi:hypothetical protein
MAGPRFMWFKHFGDSRTRWIVDTQPPAGGDEAVEVAQVQGDALARMVCLSLNSDPAALDELRDVQG